MPNVRQGSSHIFRYLNQSYCLLGDGNFATPRGSTSGNYDFLKKFLSRFFTVIIVPEYNTSQKCPKDFSQLESYDAKKGVRVKKCPSCRRSNGEGMFVVNRDFSAPMNMLAVVLGLLLYEKRPDQFRPPGYRLTDYQKKAKTSIRKRVLTKASRKNCENRPV